MMSLFLQTCCGIFCLFVHCMFSPFSSYFFFQEKKGTHQAWDGPSIECTTSFCLVITYTVMHYSYPLQDFCSS